MVIFTAIIYYTEPVSGYAIGYERDYTFDEEVVFECEQECCCKSECMHVPKPVFTAETMNNFTLNYELFHNSLRKFIRYNNLAVNRSPGKVLYRTVYEFARVLSEIVNTHSEVFENLEISSPNLFEIIDIWAAYRFVNLYKTEFTPLMDN